jgi:hypothetical protein
LKQLQEAEKLIIWGESNAKSELDCLDRFSLHPAANLAIWTIPPGPAEIQAALEKVQPTRVYLFAIDPGMDIPAAFLKRLAGLAKHILKTMEGIASLTALASATAQRISTVKAGLEWLDQSGYIKVISSIGDIVRLSAGTGQNNSAGTGDTSKINSMLAESAAFRRYYITTNTERIIIMDKE